MNKNRKEIRCILFCVLLSCFQPVFAVPRVAVYRTQAMQVNAQTVQTIDNLVYSFIKELKDFTVIDLRTQPAPQEFPTEPPIDYLFFTALQEVPEGIQVELVLKGKEAQLTRLISKVYTNINKILLDSRILVFNLFDFSVALDRFQVDTVTPQPEIEFGTVETVDALAGSWKGEAGLERIMILRGGRGMAVFSSGVSISLDFKIEDGYLLVTQKGSLQPRQFLNLPDEIARQAITKIQPPEWRFLVSPDNKVLSGKKFDAQIQYSQDAITDIQYRIDDVKWQRD